ncbi:hypothetical protein [Nocardioides bizhenqiangii]|uniref:Uncharacterized protein n=1 Tax=Nocardioides bizhenqiangii TaxID=3095076 RepID=A0ABZ0ZUY7_9ACTN|nr:MULTISPECIES: hypothetical protein [unclassified Nocardioides]MDZ5621683.1 hypothetical protein [Nocardioides sp. HM23]WQQ27631.1 hypothetical protein SHK19_05195 [Nocardioides sp. HM61]
MAPALERLEAEPVLTTLGQLRTRIGARFPKRGLYGVSGELLTLASTVAMSEARNRDRLRMVRIGSRALIAVVGVLTVLALGFALRAAIVDGGPAHDVEWLTLLESGVNDLVFAAIAIWFLYTVPERMRRADTLALLHELRSLAHVIDMHQLNKDPERLRASFTPTPVSPPMDLTFEELEHYLEYCSELLSLVGKTAALCAEESRDAVVLDTVSTIETLTIGMSRKVWQKITVLNEVRRSAG